MIPATFVFCVMFLVACTDAADPVNVTKISAPTPAIASAPAVHHDDGDDAPRISLADAKKAFDDGTAVFIDTHVKTTYDAGHIPGSINITVQDLEAKFNTIPKGKKIIAYCS